MSLRHTKMDENLSDDFVNRPGDLQNRPTFS